MTLWPDPTRERDLRELDYPAEVQSNGFICMVTIASEVFDQLTIDAQRGQAVVDEDLISRAEHDDELDAAILEARTDERQTLLDQLREWVDGEQVVAP